MLSFANRRSSAIDLAFLFPTIWEKLIFGYVIGLTIMLICRVLVPSRAMSGVIQTLVSLLSLLSFVALPVALLLQNGVLALALLVPIGVIAYRYIPHLMARDDEIPPDELQILTFNLEIKDDEESLRKQADIIRNSGAHIVGLQELCPEAADYFADHLRDTYPHQAIETNEEYVYAGQAVLSQHPIQDWYYWGHGDRDGRTELGHIVADIALEAVTITVYNTHPMPPVSESEQLEHESHEESLEELLERALSEENPVLMMGDFNMTQHFDDYDSITDYYTDALHAASESLLGLTFPVTDNWLPPLIQLDYIFFDEHFTAHKAKVLSRSGNSDHYPVWAALSYQG